MVAFLTSVVALVVISAAAMAYGYKRRAVGTPLSWGEAMAGAVVAFFAMFLAYGVIPHQWLTYAGNELGWRKDKIIFGPGDIIDKYVPFTVSPLQWAWHLVLPWLTLALVTAAVYARLTRGQMLDVLGEDYVRTARAKGLTERRVIYVHAFRSAMPPLVTQLGIDIGLMLGGVIVIEQVFGLQGVGALAISSVSMQDRPVVIAIVLLGGVFVALSNLIVDLFYALLDSRVRTRSA